MNMAFANPQRSRAPLLAVADLSISFGDRAAVRDLSFDVIEGETLAIVGESGSGKSVSALSIMGLLPPHARLSGNIEFGGRDISSLPDTQLRQIRGADIGMIFQEPMTCLNPVMTIGDQIIEGVRAHQTLSRKTARARAIELLDLVRIPDPHRRVDDYPHRLSGGMRQRVMIAMAVACSPRLLIADEPTTALDVTIQAQVLDLLDTLRRDLSMAILLITHDLGIVGQWADRVVVMYAGSKVEQGRPEALFAQPFHPYTLGLLSASPRLDDNYHYKDGLLTEIPGAIASAANECGCPFAPRCPYAQPACRAARPALFALEDERQVACPALIAGAPRAAAYSR
jgi:peptide/nickel transport system ATP-binding protein